MEVKPRIVYNFEQGSVLEALRYCIDVEKKTGIIPSAIMIYEENESLSYNSKDANRVCQYKMSINAYVYKYDLC